MKLKAIVASCALAFAGNAAALAPSTTPDVTLFVSGSSALYTMIGQVATNMMEVGTIDEFWDGTAAAAAGKSHRAYSGRASAAAIALYPSLETAPGSGVGKNILLIDRSAGGSIQGVNPVALSQSIASLDLTTCVMPTTAKINSATGLSVWSCTGTTNRIPDAGISDVEPAVLEAPVNIGTATPISAAQLASLQVAGVLGVVMGIPVTSNAPVSLQNLSKAQVAGLMGGSIQDWSLIDPTIVAGSNSVVVCRRVSGSGTQASINASIFGNPCMTSPSAPADYTATSAPLGSATPVAPGSYVVIENSSGGFVQSCLGYAKNGTPVGQAINVKSGALVAAGTANSVVLAGGDYGIGLLGLDSGTTANYNFAAINGAAATMENAASGAYDIMVEATFNHRGDLVGDQADMFALFALYSGDPAILGTAGAGGTPVPGVAALTENGWYSPVFDAALPVMRVGNFGNTCQPLQLLQ